MIERDNMKITFDIEVIDYLLSDMMLIFKEKIKTLDNNQVRKKLMLMFQQLTLISIKGKLWKQNLK